MAIVVPVGKAAQAKRSGCNVCGCFRHLGALATKLDVFVHATLFLAWVDFIEHNICDGTHDESFGKI